MFFSTNDGTTQWVNLKFLFIEKVAGPAWPFLAGGRLLMTSLSLLPQYYSRLVFGRSVYFK
jgi:hypothetical protein